MINARNEAGHRTRAVLARGFFVMAAASLAGAAAAQDAAFPSQPITTILPYSLGTFTETMLRGINQALSERFSQPVLLESRPGGGGIVGMSAVARAKPDGYTLVFTTNGTTTMLAPLRSDLPFDVVKDYAPVAMVATSYTVFATTSSFAAKSYAELVALAKAKPGQISISTLGASVNFLIARLTAATGATFLVVPYKGAADAQTAMLGGHVDVVATSLGSIKPLVDAGRARVLAIAAPQRSPRAPDVPATVETTPGVLSASWYGYLAPANTPRDRVQRLSREILAILKQPGLRDLINSGGVEVMPMAPDEFAAHMRNELQNYRELATKYNIKG